MKKLLMLGGSLSSKEIIQKAKKRGWYTIVTDMIPPEFSAAKQEADAYWMISTAEVDLLEQKCREEGIDAVFAGVSEFNLDRVSILAKDLGLPCYISEGTWEYARNKRLFKTKCIEKGIPVVPEYPVPDPDDADAWDRIVYPVVVKPVDGTGNAGLSICRNRQELIAGLRKASDFGDNPELILERYITGEETWNYYFAAEGVIRYIYSGTVYRQPGYPTFLYSFGSSAAAGVNDYLRKMDPQFSGLLKETGFREGIAWIQCIRDDEGNYYALEMAHRLSADTSGSILKKCHGIDNVEWMLDTALGIKHTADMLPEPIARPYRGATCVYYLFADHAGTIEKISGIDSLDPEEFNVEMVRQQGDNVEQYRLMVKIVFSARTAREICSILQQLNRTIGITDDNGRDLAVRFTDYEAVMQRHKGLMQTEDDSTAAEL
ncbi:MAG: hypothetical protein K6G61_11600 [Solobacterium sp.]|nr:hypothetical protein [Solobacterium sp.]